MTVTIEGVKAAFVGKETDSSGAVWVNYEAKCLCPGGSVTFIKGDVNRDGVVDLTDYSDLAKYFA